MEQVTEFFNLNIFEIIGYITLFVIMTGAVWLIVSDGDEGQGFKIGCGEKP